MATYYFFTCPKCEKKIVVIFDRKTITPEKDHILENIVCLKVGNPRGCGWEGSLPASLGQPLPQPSNQAGMDTDSSSNRFSS